MVQKVLASKNTLWNVYSAKTIALVDSRCTKQAGKLSGGTCAALCLFRKKLWGERLSYASPFASWVRAVRLPLSRSKQKEIVRLTGFPIFPRTGFRSSAGIWKIKPVGPPSRLPRSS